jgi:Tfp pilus assembly protein PilO
MEIPEQQKKLFVFVAAGLAVLFLFFQFVYAPKRRRIKRLQKELTTLESDIKRFKNLLKEEEVFAKRIFEMQEELSELDARLSQQEKLSAVIKQLTEAAERLDIEILSINPQEPRTFKDEQDNPVTLEGKFCIATPVELNLKCRYNALGDYLKSLNSAIAGLYSVDSLEIDRDEELIPLHTARLVVVVYTLSATEP